MTVRREACLVNFKKKHGKFCPRLISYIPAKRGVVKKDEGRQCTFAKGTAPSHVALRCDCLHAAGTFPRAMNTRQHDEGKRSGKRSANERSVKLRGGGHGSGAEGEPHSTHRYTLPSPPPVKSHGNVGWPQSQQASERGEGSRSSQCATSPWTVHQSTEKNKIKNKLKNKKNCRCRFVGAVVAWLRLFHYYFYAGATAIPRSHQTGPGEGGSSGRLEKCLAGKAW